MENGVNQNAAQKAADLKIFLYGDRKLEGIETETLYHYLELF